MLAGRLGINRVIATDVIRQVLRAFFSREFMPTVHYSAFEAGEAGDPWSGTARTAISSATRARPTRSARASRRSSSAPATEGTPMVIEGVHVLPGALGAS